MKIWQRIAIVMVSPLVPLLWAGTALAQDGDNTPSILHDLLVPIMVITDKLLSYWVQGNTVTDPLGKQLVASLSTIIQELVDFLAQFSLLL